MLTLGKVISVNSQDNTIEVKIPLFDMNTKAYICGSAYDAPKYELGEVVVLGFFNHDAGKPVVLGHSLSDVMLGNSYYNATPIKRLERTSSSTPSSYSAPSSTPSYSDSVPSSVGETGDIEVVSSSQDPTYTPPDPTYTPPDPTYTPPSGGEVKIVEGNKKDATATEVIVDAHGENDSDEQPSDDNVIQEIAIIDPSEFTRLSTVISSVQRLSTNNYTESDEKFLIYRFLTIAYGEKGYHEKKKLYGNTTASRNFYSSAEGKRELYKKTNSSYDGKGNYTKYGYELQYGFNDFWLTGSGENAWKFPEQWCTIFLLWCYTVTVGYNESLSRILWGGTSIGWGVSRAVMASTSGLARMFLKNLNALYTYGSSKSINGHNSINGKNNPPQAGDFLAVNSVNGHTAAVTSNAGNGFKNISTIEGNISNSVDARTRNVSQKSESSGEIIAWGRPNWGAFVWAYGVRFSTGKQYSMASTSSEFEISIKFYSKYQSGGTLYKKIKMTTPPSGEVTTIQYQRDKDDVWETAYDYKDSGWRSNYDVIFFVTTPYMTDLTPDSLYTELIAKKKTLLEHVIEKQVSQKNIRQDFLTFLKSYSTEYDLINIK